MRVVVVLEHQARGIHGRTGRVHQLDPVVRRSAVGLDLVDAHRIAAGVRRVLRRQSDIAQLTDAVGAARVDALSVSGPRVLRDGDARGRADRGGIGAAETEGEVDATVEHEPPARGHDRAGRHGGDVRGVTDRIVVEQDPARDVEGRRLSVHDLDPVRGVAVGLDLVDHDVGQHAVVGRTGRGTRQHEVPEPIGATGERRCRRVPLDRRVSLPGQRVVDERSCCVEEANAVGAADPDRVTEGCTHAAHQALGRLVDDEEAAGGQHRAGEERPAMVVGVVSELVSGEVERGGPRVVELDPVGRLRVDLVQTDAPGYGGGGADVRRTEGDDGRRRPRTGAVRAASPRGQRRGVGVGIGVDDGTGAVEEHDLVALAEAEREVRVFDEHEEGPRLQNRSGGNRADLAALVVAHLPAPDVDRGETGVEELDAVRGHARDVVVDDLVDDDAGSGRGGRGRRGCRAGSRSRGGGRSTEDVARALRRLRRDGPVRRAAGLEPVRGRRVRRPGARVHELTVRVEQARGVLAAEPEPEVADAVLLVDDVHAPGGDRRVGSEDERVRVVVIFEGEPGQRHRRRRGVDEFHPVAGGSPAGFDFVDPDARGLGCHGWERQSNDGGGAQGARCHGREGTTQGRHDTPREIGSRHWTTRG